jgi:ferric-dicitrate binding protein FerR (iron transport regulator)
MVLKIAVYSCALLAAAACVAAEKQAPSITNATSGVVASVRPGAEVMSQSGRTSALKYRETLPPGALLRTDGNGRIKIRFESGTTVSAAENTEVKLLEDTANQLTIEMAVGSLRSQGSKAAEVRTSIALARTAGGDFAVDASHPEKVQFICISGSIEVRAASGNSPVRCDAGEVVIVKLGEDPRTPIPASETLIATWQNATDPDQAPEFQPFP